MAGGIDWFRWHHGSVTDPKFQLIARKSGQALGNVIAVWAFVLETASAAQERGLVGDIDDEAIDCMLGMAGGATEAILQAMRDRGLLDGHGHVSKWHQRQPKREREDDKSTERVRAFREKQRTETPGNATERQETPREEESREEERNTSNGEYSKSAARKRTATVPRPDGVDLTVWCDWVALRRSHKSTVSATAVEGAVAEAEKAGMTLEAFLRVWCLRGSRGLQADWIKPHERSARSPPAEPEWRKEQRARIAAFAGPYAEKPAANMEPIDVVTRLVD